MNGECCLLNGASCLLNVGQLVLGQVFFGASCLGASCLWGELSWCELSLGRVVRNPVRSQTILFHIHICWLLQKGPSHIVLYI